MARRERRRSDRDARGAIIATDDPFGSELWSAIPYIVFPDDAAAAERFAGIADLSAEEVVRIEPQSSLGYPAVVVA